MHSGGKNSMLLVNLTLLRAGYCTHPEAVVIRGGKMQNKAFPALFALIEHPTRGNILFDTGYTHRFYTASRTFPLNLYKYITPVYLDDQETAVAQLTQQGISPDTVTNIILSHFHPDHIGGVADFHAAQFLCASDAYHGVVDKTGFAALKAGFMKQLLPTDFETRLSFIETCPQVALPLAMSPFESGYDLFGDNSIIAIPLPGHTAGHIGILINSTAHGLCFLIGDACWLSQAFEAFVPPHPIAKLITYNQQEYRMTLERLYQLYQSQSGVNIIPSHCDKAWLSLKHTELMQDQPCVESL